MLTFLRKLTRLVDGNVGWGSGNFRLGPGESMLCCREGSMDLAVYLLASFQAGTRGLEQGQAETCNS